MVESNPSRLGEVPATGYSVDKYSKENSTPNSPNAADITGLRAKLEESPQIVEETTYYEPKPDEDNPPQTEEEWVRQNSWRGSWP